MILVAVLLAAAPRVDRVEVDLGGVRQTKASAVRRLMSTHDGGALDEETLRRDVTRLRATGILYDVEERTEPGAEGALVTMSLKDRWTLLPVFGLRRGGGRTAARIGLSDHNAFGEPFSLYGEVTSNAHVPFPGPGPHHRPGNLPHSPRPPTVGPPFPPGPYSAP